MTIEGVLVGMVVGLLLSGLAVIFAAVWLGSRKPQQHRHYPCSEVKNRGPV